MEMSQSQVLPVSQQTAWDALNDPEVLRLCIPGCESIESTGDNEYTIAMVASIGPVKARFQGKLQITDPEPPRAYKLAFNGQGGAAGFGKGTAEVALTPVASAQADADVPAETPDAPFTRLDYAVHAQVGGKLAQIGSRLIDGAARKLAGEFFGKFDALLRERYPDQVARAAEAEAAAAGEGEAGNGTDVPGLIGVQDPTLEPTSRDSIGGSYTGAATSPASAARASRAASSHVMPIGVWAVILVVAMALIWYVTRSH